MFEAAMASEASENVLLHNGVLLGRKVAQKYSATWKVDIYLSA